jgi:hypothetical protein
MNDIPRHLPVDCRDGGAASMNQHAPKSSGE